MAHITHFVIEGLNGRRRPIELSLNRNVNVIFGANGCGKTSVLRILESALAGRASKIEDIQFERAEVKIFSDNYQMELTAICHRNDPGLKNDPVARQLFVEKFGLSGIPDNYIDKFIAREKFIGRDEYLSGREWIIRPLPPRTDVDARRSWKRTYLSTNRLYMADGSGRAIPSAKAERISEESLNSVFSTAIQSVWSKKFGEIAKETAKIQEEGLQMVLVEVFSPSPELNDKSSKFPDADLAYKRMARFLSRQDKGRLWNALKSRGDFVERYQNEPHLRNIVRHIDEVETKIENANQKIKVLTSTIKNLFSEGKEVSFDGPLIQVKSPSGKDIGVARLSSGEKHLVKILLSAIEAGSSSLIIDEPELSMHIDWQKKLISNIRAVNGDCQLICATHSPEIMAEIPDSEIFKI